MVKTYIFFCLKKKKKASKRLQTFVAVASDVTKIVDLDCMGGGIGSVWLLAKL